jgi:hypothetical protein
MEAGGLRRKRGPPPLERFQVTSRSTPGDAMIPTALSFSPLLIILVQ